jgi:RNA polymerase sigma factor (sigma-70 family)
VLLQASLRAALADLSPRQRAAVALRYIHGLTDAEIAAVLGCRAGTASSLLTRARDLLRKSGFLAIEGGIQ